MKQIFVRMDLVHFSESSFVIPANDLFLVLRSLSPNKGVLQPSTPTHSCRLRTNVAKHSLPNGHNLVKKIDGFHLKSVLSNLLSKHERTSGQ